jgi:hypothetical protein
VTAKRIPLLVLVLAGSIVAACSGSKPFLLQGDANSAQVGYSGNVDDATPVAKKHCAQYERVPRFLEAEENIAFFDCVRP